jgi:tRNA(adenine34) deaminase
VHVSYLEDDPDRLHMELALREARRAGEAGEAPIGAVILHPQQGIVAKARNRKEALRDATAHAEILAIGQASGALGDWRLEECTLYVTLEPCAMCAGAIIQARIPRLVFGARDPKAGAVDSVVQLLEPGLFNHEVVWVGGVLEEKCGEVLTAFFRDRRGRSPE